MTTPIQQITELHPLVRDIIDKNPGVFDEHKLVEELWNRTPKNKVEDFFKQLAVPYFGNALRNDRPTALNHALGANPQMPQPAASNGSPTTASATETTESTTTTEPPKPKQRRQSHSAKQRKKADWWTRAKACPLKFGPGKADEKRLGSFTDEELNFPIDAYDTLIGNIAHQRDYLIWIQKQLREYGVKTVDDLPTPQEPWAA